MLRVAISTTAMSVATVADHTNFGETDAWWLPSAICYLYLSLIINATQPGKLTRPRAFNYKRGACGTPRETKRGPTGPRSQTTERRGQTFSSSSVRPRGLRISSMKACISCDGSLVMRLTT